MLFSVAVALYGASTVYALFLWRRGFRLDNRITYLLLFASWMFHTFSMVQRGMSFARCPVSNLYEATVFVGWSITTAYLVIGLWRKVRFLGAFASPLLFGVGVFALIPTLDRTAEAETLVMNGWTSLHITLILLAYGAFGLASIASVMYLTQEHNLKFHKLQAALSLLPPIQRLEKVSGYLIQIGAVLMIVGLYLGARVARAEESMDLRGDPKVYWSLLVSLAYVTLVIMRWRFGLLGRRFAWAVAGCFIFILLTFWGTNLLSEIHNP